MLQRNRKMKLVGGKRRKNEGKRRKKEEKGRGMKKDNKKE
jgi:hypothetical protein